MSKAEKHPTYALGSKVLTVNGGRMGKAQKDSRKRLERLEDEHKPAAQVDLTTKQRNQAAARQSAQDDALVRIQKATGKDWDTFRLEALEATGAVDEPGKAVQQAHAVLGAVNDAITWEARALGALWADDPTMWDGLAEAYAWAVLEPDPDTPIAPSQAAAERVTRAQTLATVREAISVLCGFYQQATGATGKELTQARKLLEERTSLDSPTLAKSMPTPAELFEAVNQRTRQQDKLRELGALRRQLEGIEEELETQPRYLAAQQRGAWEKGKGKELREQADALRKQIDNLAAVVAA